VCGHANVCGILLGSGQQNFHGRDVFAPVARGSQKVRKAPPWAKKLPTIKKVPCLRPKARDGVPRAWCCRGHFEISSQFPSGRHFFFARRRYRNGRYKSPRPSSVNKVVDTFAQGIRRTVLPTSAPSFRDIGIIAGNAQKAWASARARTSLLHSVSSCLNFRKLLQISGSAICEWVRGSSQSRQASPTN